MRLLFLCQTMAKGFGVSVVVQALAAALRVHGHAVAVGCLESDGHFAAEGVLHLPPTPQAVLEFARKWKPDVIIGHTTPFFEMLPALTGEFRCWAWEHGDPTPELFVAHGDSEGRRAIAEWKRRHVYPVLEGVIAISEFIRHDIEWPAAYVIYNGADHVAASGPRPAWQYALVRPLRVGTLMRLGRGESFYKGGGIFRGLVAAARERGLGCRFAVMGRGMEDEARQFRADGIEAHLNASDAERAEFLRGLDVFVSCSLWEGFNLPLVEAAMCGAVSLAFDTGAHPEVTPLVVANQHQLLLQIESYAADRELLARHAALCHRHALRFSWNSAAVELIRLLGGTLQAPSAPGFFPVSPLQRCLVFVEPRRLLQRTLHSLRHEGFVPWLRRVRSYLVGRFPRRMGR